MRLIKPFDCDMALRFQGQHAHMKPYQSWRLNTMVISRTPAHRLLIALFESCRHVETTDGAYYGRNCWLQKM